MKLAVLSKFTCRLTMLMLFLSALLFSVYSQEGEKMRVGVVEFDVKGNVDIADAGAIIAEWVNNAIIRTGKYTVIERLLLKKVLAEQELQLSGLIDESTAVRIGRIFGTNAIITGSVIEWKGIISVISRMVDTTTGVILSSAEIKTDAPKSIPDKVDEIARVLAGEIDQEKLNEENTAMVKAIGIDSLGNFPVSIIKITKQGAKTTGVINAGLYQKIQKGMSYLIYVPEYAESQISGKKTITGKKCVASIKIDYVETFMGAGELETVSGYGSNMDEIISQGVALPFYGSSSIDIATFNAGVKWGMSLKSLDSTLGFSFGYAVDPLYSPFLLGQICMGFNYDFCFLGNYLSVLKLKAGAAVSGSFYHLFSEHISTGYIPFIFNLLAGPYLEFDIYNFYIKPGIGAGVGFGDFMYFIFPAPLDTIPIALQPWLEIGIHIF